jgi:hypothetical protein
MKKKTFRLNIDGETIDYPCSKWEVSCILVPASTTKLYVEFKNYAADGTQVTKTHYATSFKIIEHASLHDLFSILQRRKQKIYTFFKNAFGRLVQGL